MVKRKKLLNENKKLFFKAKRYLVGGVDSPVRAFNYVGGSPLLINKGKGCKVYDYNNKEYIDYVLSWGSLILGHAYPEVINAINKESSKGLSFGTTHKAEIELAQGINKAIPLAQKIRFVNSGTEAVMGAIRLARGYTKRDKIVKFSHSYHGHADYLLASGGSGLATLNIAQSKGVPKDFIKETIVIPYADKKYLGKVFKKYGEKIAAVIFEPIGANYGVTLPDINFLKYLRKLTRKYGALLIADEVITGFRFNFGSLSSEFDITPDLICLGKIIGGGLPIGAYAGPNKIMNNLAPLGKVYQASTFSGNPIVMQAGLETLNALNNLKNSYNRLEVLARKLSIGLEREAESCGVKLKVSYYKNMFSFKFQKKINFVKFYREMLIKGIYFAPSEFEANFLSFAHREKDINETLIKAKEIFKRSV